jgi:GDP-L-fucose synthase
VLLERYRGEEPINVGSGQVESVRELAEIVKAIVGFEGEIYWDRLRPDGAPEKRLDSSLINGFGWSARTPLRAGVEQTYHWFLEHEAAAIGREAPCISS